MAGAPPETGAEDLAVTPSVELRLRYSRAMSAALEVAGHEVSIWRRRSDCFRFPIEAGQMVDLGPWRSFGWPQADLPEAEAHYAALRRLESEPFRAYYQRDALVVGPHLVVCAGDRVLAESTRGLAILTKRAPFRRVEGFNGVTVAPKTRSRRPGLSVVVGTRASAEYFHWMTEMLPRLVLGAQLARLHAGTLLLLGVSRGYQRETLETITPGTEVAFADAEAIACEEVIFPDHVIRSGPVARTMARRAGDGFDHLLAAFRTPARHPTRRLYVSRRDAARRHIENEEQLLPVLRRHGFEVVTLSGMKVAEQAGMFRDAVMVVGQHGAGLTNTGFCWPGTPVIEILPAGGRILSPYHSLAGIRNLPYLCLAGTDGRGGSPDINGDYTVDHEALEQSILAAAALTPYTTQA